MERYVKIYKKIDEIKDIWDSLYSGGNDMTPYQSFEWNRNVAECYKSNTYIFLNFTVRYFVLFDDQEPIVIAPLALPKNKFNEETYVQILGEYTKINGLNFVYGNDAAGEDFRFLIEYVLNTYRCAVKFCDVSDATKFGAFLSEYETAEKTAGRQCVKCAVPASSDEVYNSLSEKSRKIIDEYHKDESHNINVEIFRSYRFTNEELDGLEELRNKFQNKPKSLVSGTKAFKKIQRKIFRNRESVVSFSESENFVFAKCVIDGRTAGFFFGITDMSGYCIVPEMIIDYFYGEYCPELLMIYEFISRAAENESLSVFDFSRWCMEYGTDCVPGAEEYRNGDYKIKAEIPSLNVTEDE